ncbi:RIP metalloprotease RseP [Erythrobacter crassostreae]|uniref:Zinc metalloprotease n=1 Tax=Erythrobacter crassostreae TaxID=2828328 RepID=A0A9X1F3K7_9SPHN|nr:RIP metalloprotease RseP [Erythrobacter crassostrea]MBV7259666.1 RIP metalloprotease RseP [Erythrobacter crassostrea]
MYIVGFLFVLGPLITFHELGHYLVGRWFGVKAEAFSVGFGKEVWGRTDKHGTRWKLSALPLGGYVQFKGDMNPASAPDAEANAGLTPEQSEGNFHLAALWKRALIVAAGPVTNLLITFALFAALFAFHGKLTIVGAEDSRIVGEFSETSAAKAAGIEIGDKIIAIDNESIEDFESIRREVALYPDREMVIRVDRGGEELDFPVKAARVEVTDTFGNSSDIGQLGVGPYGGEYVLEEVGALESIPVAVAHTGDVFSMMLTGIKQILTGERSIKELGGPIKIAKYSGEQMSLGLTTFINFVALISLNLAFINFLPIPALDGGHLAFYAAEAVRKKPVGPQATEWAYRTGIALVLVFMVVVTVNDVTSLSIFGAIFG